jgi:glycosyltransferase involved in cell wall biosynthesis
MSDMAERMSRAATKTTLISIGVAVFQNAGSLRGLVDEIFEAFGTGLPDVKFEIVFVNDGSTDGSEEVLSELAGKHPDVISVVHFTRNFGQLFAMIAAVDHAAGSHLGRRRHGAILEGRQRNRYCPSREP